jgi:hypothetical protein
MVTAASVDAVPNPCSAADAGTAAMQATTESAATEARAFLKLIFFILVHFLSNEFYLQSPHRTAVR